MYFCTYEIECSGFIGMAYMSGTWDAELDQEAVAVPQGPSLGTGNQEHRQKPGEPSQHFQYLVYFLFNSVSKSRMMLFLPPSHLFHLQELEECVLKINTYWKLLYWSLKLINLGKLVMQNRTFIFNWMKVYSPLNSVCCKTWELPCRSQSPCMRRSLRLAPSERLPPGTVSLPLHVWCTAHL